MKKNFIYYMLPILALCVYACHPSGKDTLPYKDATLTIEQRIDDLLGRMTLEEKISQMQHIHSYQFLDDQSLNLSKLEEISKGNSLGCVEATILPGQNCAEIMFAIQKYMVENTRLGIPIFTCTESLHGSAQDGSTIFPQTIALGSTFNPELVYKMTVSVASELKAQGIWQTLNPIVDVARDLRWGRIEECFGEDPLLVTQMGLHQVQAYLNNGISPMLKHFGAHGNPTGGLNLASVSAGQRELLSVYLKPFEVIIKEAKPWAVMSSYNSWNNEPNSSSFYLQTELLRNQWGFKGYLYSDWGAIAMLNYFHRTAQNNADAAIQALQSGMDIEAAGNCYEELKELVTNGLLEEKYIDTAVRRILRAKFTMGMFENPYRKVDNYDEVVHSQQHIALAREIAEESVVLLKNDNNLLPLDITKIRSIALIGPNADQVQFGDYTWSRSNKDGVTLLNALKTNYGEKLKINYAKGCDLISDNKGGFKEAKTKALMSDITVLVVGSASASLARDYSNVTCGEGFDLSDLNLTGVQEDLIKEIHATGKPIVLVLLSGKPFSIPWVKENIPSILVQWYPGEQGGNALADILFGKINPSGKLNYSFPQSIGHLPCYYNHLPTDKGYYKHRGTKDTPGRDYVFSSPDALWAFGHGLSYTDFEYISITTSKEDYQQNDKIDITVTVQNKGNSDGKEVVQVYVRDLVSSVVTPVHDLKGFKKVLIKQGEIADVKITIPVAELALYNKEMKRVVEAGAFELQAGRASDDIRIRKIITVEKDKEHKIKTKKERSENGQPRSQSVISMSVKGVLRDVQSNTLFKVPVRVQDKVVYTNDKGQFSINALSSDTLLVGGDKYQQEIIPVNGRQVINVSLLPSKK